MSPAAGQVPYLYVAVTPTGGRRIGLVRGRDLRHAADQLRRRRLVPIKTWTLPAWAASPDRAASLKDQSELHLQLAQLLGRGVPLVEALEVTTQSVSPSSRSRVERMKELVSSGSSFAEACRAVEMFDPVTIAVYRASERTGDLAGAAKQLSTTVRRQLTIRGKVVTLMLYPCIVLSISIAASLFLLVYLVPKVGKALEDQFRSQGQELPAFTRVVMALGLFLREHWLVSVLGMLVAITAGVFLRKRLATILGAATRRTPLLREVVLAQESARFFTVMAAMTRSGIPLADALGVATGVLGHPVLRFQLSLLRQKLIDGGVLRHLIDQVTALPPGTRRLMIAAERSGDMEQAFETLGADMAEELDRRSSRLLAALEPALIVLMAFMIGTLLLAIMIPMLSVAGQVQ